MRYERLDGETVIISGLNPFVCELLLQIPISADPAGSAEAEARLYSSPTAEDEPELREDWREYVRPGLQEHFDAAMHVVLSDLAGFPPEEEPEEGHTLRLPIAHLESWINALNQSRLALAARHGITEKDMHRLPVEGGVRALAIVQIDLYAQLQECFIHTING